MMISLLSVVLLLFGGTSHGDLDLRILALTNQIIADPENVELRVKRGDLYIQHEEFDNAKIDFIYCLRHGFHNTRVYSGLSKAYLHNGVIDSALYYIDKVVEKEPDNLSALETKASAFISAGKSCEAVSIYQLIIDKAQTQSPQLFIQASAASKNCDSNDNDEVAIEILKSGILILPENKLLQNQLVSLLRHNKKFDEAIIIQSSIIESAGFKARHYLDRAAIYVELNATQLATADLESALQHIALMPAHRRDVPAMQILNDEIQGLLNELKAKG